LREGPALTRRRHETKTKPRKPSKRNQEYTRDYAYDQGDHLSGKPGNVREFDSCQGNVRDFTKNQGIVREMSMRKSCVLVREKLPKTVYCQLHICIHTGI